MREFMDGWYYAKANPEEAVGIVMDHDEIGA